MATPIRVPLICGGHSRPVPHLSFSPQLPEGVFIASGCLDGKAMLRNGLTGDWIGTFSGHKGAVWSARINKAATRVFTGSADFTLKIWSAITGKELGTIEHKHVVKTVDISPDELQCLSAGLDKKLKLWDVASASAVATLEGGHSRGINSAVWLSEHSILTGGGEAGVKLWDTRSGSVVKVLDTLSEKVVRSLEVTSDPSSRVVSCAAGKTAFFFSAESFELVKSYTCEGEINWASLHPSSAGTFAVACVDAFRVMVCNYDTGAEISRHGGHHGPPHCVRWAPNGEYFASGSDDGTIRLWRNVEEVEKEQVVLRKELQERLEQERREKAEKERLEKEEKERQELEEKKQQEIEEKERHEREEKERQENEKVLESDAPDKEEQADDETAEEKKDSGESGITVESDVGTPSGPDAPAGSSEVPMATGVAS